MTVSTAKDAHVAESYKYPVKDVGCPSRKKKKTDVGLWSPLEKGQPLVV